MPPTTRRFDFSNNKTTSNINPQSPKYVIGRYAYTIYNEGGLLDANVAGSPNGAGVAYSNAIAEYPPTQLGKTPGT